MFINLTKLNTALVKVCNLGRNQVEHVPVSFGFRFWPHAIQVAPGLANTWYTHVTLLFGYWCNWLQCTWSSHNWASNGLHRGLWSSTWVWTHVWTSQFWLRSQTFPKYPLIHNIRGRFVRTGQHRVFHAKKEIFCTANRQNFVHF